jgi:hypothetical protein
VPLRRVAPFGQTLLPLQPRVQPHVIQIVRPGGLIAAQQLQQPGPAGIAQLLFGQFAEELRQFGKNIVLVTLRVTPPLTRNVRSTFLAKIGHGRSLPASFRWMQSSRA